MQQQQVLQILIILVISTCWAKYLSVHNTESLRQALIEEGIEVTLGSLGGNDSTLAQGTLEQLYKQLNDPVYVFERTMCLQQDARCMACRFAASLHRPNFAQFAKSQIDCNKHYTCDCTTKQAKFFKQWKYREFVTLSKPSATVQQFLEAYKPDYDVHLETMIGELQYKQIKKVRQAQLYSAKEMFNLGKVHMGNAYVGCMIVSYTHKNSAKTIMRLNACSEFTLNMGNQYALKFMYQMYLRAEAELVALSQPLLKRLYKLFDVMIPELTKCNDRAKRIDELTKEIEHQSGSHSYTAKELEAERKNLAKLSKERNKLIHDLLARWGKGIRKQAASTLSWREQQLLVVEADTLRMAVKGIDNGTTCVTISNTYVYTASFTCRSVNIFISIDEVIE